MSEITIDEKIKKMFEAGAHIGYSKTRRHPSTVPYIFTTKNSGDIIDLEKTAELLEKAKETIKGLATGGKQILFVGTKPEARKITRGVAEKLGMPYIDQRWIGGTLTNFTEIRKRINLLMDLQYKREHNELVFKTKKERLMIEREIITLEKMFGGLTGLKSMPDMVCIVDSGAEPIAVDEANRMSVPVMAISSTDCNIDRVTFPIVANDGATASIQFFMDELASAYESGK